MGAIVRLRLIQGLAAVAAIVSLGLFLLTPDVERYLQLHLPGNPMPDAFHGLNGSLAIFMLLVTATLLLGIRIEVHRQQLLILPLLFGPVACFLGWGLTENFTDPNWFHLFAATSIGMLVSCMVTGFLSIATIEKAEQAAETDAVD